MKTGAASPTVTEALWYDLRDLELKLTWGTENWPYGRTLKNKLGSYMFKINITCNVPSDLSEVLCLAWLLLFLIWHAWPKSKKIALPRWNLWPLCASGSLCCIFQASGCPRRRGHALNTRPWFLHALSLLGAGVCVWRRLELFVVRLPSIGGMVQKISIAFSKFRFNVTGELFSSKVNL